MPLKFDIAKDSVCVMEVKREVGLCGGMVQQSKNQVCACLGTIMIIYEAM